MNNLLRKHRAIGLISIIVLAIALSGCTFSFPPFSWPKWPPDLQGSFQMTIFGIGGRSEKYKFGDAYVRVTMKGELYAFVNETKTGSPTKLTMIGINVTQGKITVRCYNVTDGKWHLNVRDLKGMILYWQDDEVNGEITGGTWTVKDEAISFRIKWDTSFTRASIRGFANIINEINWIGPISGSATIP